MSPLPFVSVIVPTYNRAHLLKQLLWSLAHQDYPKDRYEVIVVDDGSSDETSKVVNELRQQLPYALKYLQQIRRGPAAARNFGVQHSKGEILAFVDDDVTVAPDWLKNAVRQLAHADGVEGKTVPLGEQISPFIHKVHNLNGGQYLTCNIFYRRSVFEQVGGFDERFRRAHREDTDLAWRVMDAGAKIVFAPDVVVFHPIVPVHPLKALKSFSVYQYDYLLRFKHPKRFQEAGWIVNLAPHLRHCAAGILFVVGCLFKQPIIALPAGLFLLLRTLKSTKNALRGYSVTLRLLIWTFIYCLIVPFVNIGVRAVGYLRFLPERFKRTKG